jgi:hypothetical protein
LTGFVAENPNLSVFVLGFAVFCGAIASYSRPLAGAVGGAILMAVAVYPFLMPRKS